MTIEPETITPAPGPKVACPHCGEQTEGRLNSRKELRCTACWGVLPPAPVKDEPAAPVAETKEDPALKSSKPRPKANG